MEKTLKSLDGYSTLELDFEKIDFLSDKNITEILKEISDGIVIVAEKNKSVYAVPVVLGEEVDTRIRFNVNGRVYTLDEHQTTITEKDIETDTQKLLYNDGEVVLVRGERFEENYTLENKEWNLYRPQEIPKKFVTTTKHIYFKTIWGEEVYAPKGSKLCIDYMIERDFYIVTNSFFKVAYNKIEEYSL